MFWTREYAPRENRKNRLDITPDPPGARSRRWTHTCAWDGHELGDIDFIQASPHERVCRFHYSQFQAWIEDLSKRKYRFDQDEEV